MKNYLFILFVLAILFCSCNDTSSESSSDAPKNSSDTTALSDSIPVEPKDDRITLIVMVDGPDEELYITNEGDYSTNTLVEASEIDIIPYVYGADAGDDIYDEMRIIARDNFQFYYGPLAEYTGKVNLYYDQYKTTLASSWELENGKPDGSCVLYDSDGGIYIERVYKNGVWQYSGTEPYAVNWTYDQANSSLLIIDTANAYYNDDLVKIMHSFKDNSWTYMDQIVEKKSFENAFKINGDPYTGKLVAYQHPTYYDDLKEFELNFKDGYLHGDIKIFNWWGELELHEIFDNGAFVEEVYKMDESMMDGVAKPIIYLYPEKETKISVQLNFDGQLTHTYPKYKHGWHVSASPDGTLQDGNGKEYYALYWEGHEHTPLSIPNGTVLKGEETIAFLEEELPKMGLNAKETNEFIIYWMPHLENNPYNLIHFSSTAYTDMAQLAITPKPETLIRVMMVFQPLDTPVEIEPQNLSELYKERKGFTVVEWGGRKLAKTLN